MENGLKVRRFPGRHFDVTVFSLTTLAGTFCIDSPFTGRDDVDPPFGIYWLLAFLNVVALLWNRLGWPKIGIIFYAVLIATFSVVFSLETVEPSLSALYGTDAYYGEPLVPWFWGNFLFFLVLNGFAMLFAMIVLWTKPVEIT